MSSLRQRVHRDRVGDWLFFHEKILLAEEVDHHLPAGLAIGASERSGGRRHHPALVDHREHRQAVALADLEVGLVVPGRDL